MKLLEKSDTLCKALEAEKLRSSQIKNDRKISFKVNNVLNELLEKEPSIKEINKELEGILESKKKDKKISKNILLGLVRFIFLCQPVNESVTSTIFSFRWDMLNSDSRYASLDSCIDIFNQFTKKIIDFLDSSNDEDIESFIAYINFPSCPYDIPLDYITLATTPIHRNDNIILYSPDDFGTIFKKRKLLIELLSSIELPSKIFEKIDVSAYKTERSLTGDFKTNREYRWETISNSDQGATKKNCWMVEIKLMEQICCMEGFPREKIPSDLNDLKEFTTVCPVMLLPIQYDDLIKEGKNSTHGESLIQLGHINPKSNHLGAHNKDNISWISNEGNRIQGNSSIEEIHKKITELVNRLKDIGKI